MNANFTNYQSQTMGKGEVRLIDVLKQKPKTKIAGDTKKQKKEDEEVYV